MKFIIHFVAIILCAKLVASIPLLQLIDNEDDILAKDVISISNESKGSSSESSSSSSEETSQYPVDLETHLFRLNATVASLVPYVQDELEENFESANGSLQGNKIQSYGIQSSYNIPWLAGISFHKSNSDEQDELDDANLTVSGEFFETEAPTEITTLSDKSVDKSTRKSTTVDSVKTTVAKTTTTTIVPTRKETVTVSNVTSTTTESIKEKLIEKIAEIAAEPIILTQGVR